jgi:predicted MFS family arabinose efflux permease
VGIPGIDAIPVRDGAYEIGRLREARWSTTTFFLLLGIVLGSWVARIPAVQNSLQLDDARLGISLLSTSVGAILAMPATGWLIREWGNPQVMRIAATVLCVSLPLLPVAPTMPLLMLSLLIFGIGFGLLDVSMNVQAVTVEEGYARPIMSTFHGVFSVGGLLGAAIAGVVAGVGVPPFTHLLGVALVLLVLIAVASRSLWRLVLPRMGHRCLRFRRERCSGSASSASACCSGRAPWPTGAPSTSRMSWVRQRL